MARKTVSISIYQPTLERLDARVGRLSRSERLSQDLTRYWDLLGAGLAQARKKLTKPEASLILDVQNGTYVDDGPAFARWVIGDSLAFQISDAISLDGLDQKWGVDGPALLEKVRGLGHAETLALLDWAARYWGDEKADLDAYRDGFLD